MIRIAHVDVPKDLNGIRTTFAFGMSGIQLIMLFAGAVMALILTTLLRNGFGLTLFSSFLISSVPTLVPIAFCAFYKKNGMSFGKIAKIVLRHKLRHKQVRLYRTENFYFQFDKSSTLKNNSRKEELNVKNSPKNISKHISKKAEKQTHRNQKR